MVRRRGPAKSPAARCFPLRRRLSNVSRPARTACTRVPRGRESAQWAAPTRCSRSIRVLRCDDQVTSTICPTNSNLTLQPMACNGLCNFLRPHRTSGTVAPERWLYETFTTAIAARAIGRFASMLRENDRDICSKLTNFKKLKYSFFAETTVNMVHLHWLINYSFFID